MVNYLGKEEITKGIISGNLEGEEVEVEEEDGGITTTIMIDNINVRDSRDNKRKEEIVEIEISEIIMMIIDNGNKKVTINIITKEETTIEETSIMTDIKINFRIKIILRSRKHRYLSIRLKLSQRWRNSNLRW